MILSETALDLVFREARTHNRWLDRPVDDETLRALYDLLKWGPTSANCLPARIVFVRSRDSKERLRPALSAGNADKTMAAPVTAIIGYDLRFFDKLPRLFPHTDARSWFVGKQSLIDDLIGPLFAQLKAGIASSVENLVGEGDIVVVQSRGTAETKDGVPYNNAYCQVMRIRDGRICEVTEYFDTQLAANVLRRS